MAGHVSDDNEKLAIWKLAKESNPDQAWPFDKTIDVLVGAKDWKEFQNQLDRIGRVAATKSKGYRALYIWNTVYFFDRKSLSTRLTVEELNEALSACEKLEAIGTPAVYPTWIPQRFRKLFARLSGNKALATEAVASEAKQLPDSTGWSGAFNDSMSDEIGLKRLFTIGFHYLERRPFDGDRIDDVAERHLQWGGSALVSAFLYELMSVVCLLYTSPSPRDRG